MKALFVAVVALSLAGCAIQRAQTAQEARSQLIGMSKEQILSCMGAPENAATVGQTEVWTYSSGNGMMISSGDTQFRRSGFGGIAADTNAISHRRFCKVNVVMSNGAVSAVNYQGPTGGLLTAGEQCAYAVETCVRR